MAAVPGRAALSLGWLPEKPCSGLRRTFYSLPEARGTRSGRTPSKYVRSWIRLARQRDRPADFACRDALAFEGVRAELTSARQDSGALAPRPVVRLQAVAAAGCCAKAAADATAMVTISGRGCVIAGEFGEKASTGRAQGPPTSHSASGIGRSHSRGEGAVRSDAGERVGSALPLRGAEKRSLRACPHGYGGGWGWPGAGRASVGPRC